MILIIMHIYQYRNNRSLEDTVDAFLSEWLQTTAIIDFLDDVDAVKLLLSDSEVKPDVNNSQALRDAVKSNNVEVVKMLLDDDREHRSLPDANDSEALREAVKSGNLEIFKLLFNDNREHRAKPDARNSEVLRLAVKYGNMEALKLLLSDSREHRALPAPKTNNCVKYKPILDDHMLPVFNFIHDRVCMAAYARLFMEHLINAMIGSSNYSPSEAIQKLDVMGVITSDMKKHLHNLRMICNDLLHVSATEREHSVMGIAMEVVLIAFGLDEMSHGNISPLVPRTPADAAISPDRTATSSDQGEPKKFRKRDQWHQKSFKAQYHKLKNVLGRPTFFNSIGSQAKWFLENNNKVKIAICPFSEDNISLQSPIRWTIQSPDRKALSQQMLALSVK